MQYLLGCPNILGTGEMDMLFVMIFLYLFWENTQKKLEFFGLTLRRSTSKNEVVRECKTIISKAVLV